MKVVLAQLRPAPRDLRTNAQTMARVVGEHGGADLVVFPELFLSGYTTDSPGELAVDAGGPEVGEVARAARENDSAVVFGAPERVEGGIANSAVCLDRRGDTVGSYRKTHLFGEERGAFVAGEELLVADIDGLKVGMMVCFDVEFPEVARSLALAGADLLVTISANMDPFGRDHDVFATARALENGLPHLYVNQFGRGEAFTFAGGTMAVSADGDRLAEIAPREEVASFDLDLSAKSEAKPEDLRPDYLNERRGELPVANTQSQKDG